jgi:hypothetical protein
VYKNGKPNLFTVLANVGKRRDILTLSPPGIAVSQLPEKRK